VIVRRRVVSEVNLSDDSFTNPDGSPLSKEILSPRVKPKVVTPNSSAKCSLRSQFDFEADSDIHGPGFCNDSNDTDNADTEDRDNRFSTLDETTLLTDDQYESNSDKISIVPGTQMSPTFASRLHVAQFLT